MITVPIKEVVVVPVKVVVGCSVKEVGGVSIKEGEGGIEDWEMSTGRAAKYGLLRK
ncbi:hypothetical protein HPY86_04385 [candidate division WOR-3 bacterium]|nr:hypothetical protein [candidate division WOR-3 bacterium]